VRRQGKPQKVSFEQSIARREKVKIHLQMHNKSGITSKVVTRIK
jgi:hypothetical protein